EGQEDGDLPLVIPATAPLLTGDRAVVYVRRLLDGQSVFSGRQVVLGSRAGEDYIVAAGLSEGEEVVTRGSFKIDSALQIQAQPSMMNPTGGGAVPGHDHGGGGMEMADREMVGEMPEVAPFVAPECFNAGLGTVVDKYYALQKALAGDDDGQARMAAHGVHQALSELECDVAQLDANGAKFWKMITDELTTATMLTAGAEDIAARRMAFEPLSDTLWLAVSTFKAGAGTPVRRFHCPMAMDGAGAFWLQAGETTANPYYGASMLRCGSQVELTGGGK
ncbi:MAG: DUF3347 domain-containing protein, partial [Candidatus Krumholzibacteria bacterium]|nr:DUF3347 domain-containing protein [Candidatus Krumholzibacteria bacterium]